MDEAARSAEIAELRRRLEELESSAAAPAEPPAAAEAAAPTVQRKGWSPGLLLGLGAIGLLFVWAAVVSLQKPKPEDPAALAAQGAAYRAAAASEAALASGKPNSGEWTYTQDPDGMTDGVNRFACVDSLSEVALNSPYPTQAPRLCFRRSPRQGLDAMIQLVEGGQFICHSYMDECSVKVRFDNGPMLRFSAAEPSDGSSNVLFVRNAARLLDAAKGHTLMKIEAEFYEAGLQQMDFPVNALDRSRLGPPAKP